MADIEPVARPVVIRPHDPVPAGYTDTDFTISAAAVERLINAPAENTKLAHQRDWGEYERWCAAADRIALPATAQTLLEYVTYLIEEREPKLAPASIDRAMGSIRAIHAERGYEDQPGIKPARRVFRAFKRQWADDGNRARKATPVKIPAIRAMIDTCDLATAAGIRDRAIILLGFGLMARRSELAGLDIADVQPGKEGLDVFIKRSKTDQEAKGREVPVLAGQHPETCPVRAVQEWIALLAEHDITSGPLFRPIDRHGRIGDDLAAAGKPRVRLSGRSVAEIVRRHAVAAGLSGPSGYKGHSLRSGGASSAYEAGAPIAGIAGQGGWNEQSPVVLGYVRAVDKWKNHPMRGVGL